MRFSDPEIGRRVRALGQHSPPALVWFDADGTMHRRCITDDPNPDCNGCQETGKPQGQHWRFDPGHATARETSLLLYGSWTDGTRHPCELCGTALVLVEHRDNSRPDRPEWSNRLEVLREDPPGGVPNMMFREHDAEWCRRLSVPGGTVTG